GGRGPFPDVAREVVQAAGRVSRWERADRAGTVALGRARPAHLIGRGAVAPREGVGPGAAARGPFPFVGGRQALALGAAIGRSLIEADAVDRVILATGRGERGGRAARIAAQVVRRALMRADAGRVRAGG